MGNDTRRKCGGVLELNSALNALAEDYPATPWSLPDSTPSRSEMLIRQRKKRPAPTQPGGRVHALGMVRKRMKDETVDQVTGQTQTYHYGQQIESESGGSLGLLPAHRLQPAEAESPLSDVIEVLSAHGEQSGPCAHSITD